MSLNVITPAETAAAREARVNRELMLQYQRDWVQDRSLIKAVEKCRQCGISWTEAFITMDETAKADAKRDSWVSSRDLTQARLFISDVKFWARMQNRAAKDQGERVIDEERGFKAFQLDFDTGRSVYSMSSNPDAQAGKRGRRVLDEFALHKDQRQMYAIAYPGIQWGGSLVFISTHRGTHSFFNRELVMDAKGDNRKKISLHTITIQRAVQDGLWIKIKKQLEKDDPRIGYDDDAFLQSLRDGCPDEETWLQEYCCTPADDAAAFLTWEDLTACSESAAEREARVIPPGSVRSIGYDVARRRDLSVITTLADVAGKLIVEKVIVMKQTPFADQVQRLREEQARCEKAAGSPPRIAIDASGLGMPIAEAAQKEWRESNVLAVTFTSKSKAELAMPMLASFQDRALRIPDERDYLADLRSVKKAVGAGGAITLTTEAGETDGHADRFWSLALAHHARRSAPAATGIVSLGSGIKKTVAAWWNSNRRGVD